MCVPQGTGPFRLIPQGCTQFFFFFKKCSKSKGEGDRDLVIEMILENNWSERL